MPFVEGVGIVDVSSSKVLATVSRGRLSHSTVESQLKSALSDSNIAWENSLCIATPVHIVAITQARRRPQRQITSRRTRGSRHGEDNFVNVEDTHGESSFVEDECDWETFVFPILDRCSKVVLAACGPKPTALRIEKNFAAVYLGLMKVLVLGCDGVSTVLAVNKRASGLMPWPSSSKSKADDHPLLSATVLDGGDDEMNNKNESKAQSMKFMLESASVLEQIRLDLPRSEMNGQTVNVALDAIEDEDTQLLSMFGSSFQPPQLAYNNNRWDDDIEDLEFNGAFQDEENDNNEYELGDYEEEEEEEDGERNSHSTEEKEFIDGQPRGNYSRIKVATPTRKRRTLSTGARERLKEETDRARNRGEGKSGEDGPLRKKTSSSLEGVRVPEEAAAALAALEGQDVGRDLAGSLSQEEDETFVIPPPLFSPPSQLNNSGWFAEDADAAPPPFSPPSSHVQETPIATAAVASRAMSLSYVPPPDEPPPAEEDEVDDEEHIASPFTPPLDDDEEGIVQNEEEDVLEYGSYSGRTFPPPLPSHGSFSSYESAAGLFNRTSMHVPADTVSEEDVDIRGKGEVYGPTTPIVPPPFGDGHANHEDDDEDDSVLSPLDPPSDYVEEQDEDDDGGAIIPPPSFPPPLSEGEEEDSRPGDTSGQSSTWGLPPSMQRYATTARMDNEQHQGVEAHEDGGSSQASNDERGLEEDGDSLTDFDPFADSTDDIMSSPALQVVLPPPLFSPEVSSDEEEGRFASSSAIETHDGSDDENYFGVDSAPPPPGPPPPLDESDDDDLEKTKILEQPLMVAKNTRSEASAVQNKGEEASLMQHGSISPRRASVPPPAFAPPSDDENNDMDHDDEEDDDAAPPPSSPPPPLEQEPTSGYIPVQAPMMSTMEQQQEEEEEMIAPPLASPSPSDDEHVQEKERGFVQDSVAEQGPASPVPRVMECDETDILPPPESPSSTEGEEQPSHSFFSGHFADTSAYVDDDENDEPASDEHDNVDEMVQVGETDIPPPSSSPPKEEETDEAREEPVVHKEENKISAVVDATRNKLDESSNSDHVHVLVSLSDDPSMSQIMMSEADSYLTNESSLSPNRSPNRSYLGRQPATHQSMTSVAEEQQTDLDDSSSSINLQTGINDKNVSSNGQTMKSTVMAGSASNVVVASRRVSDPPPTAILSSIPHQQPPIRIDLHVHEDCVMRIQRGSFVQAPKFRAKLYVGSPEAAAALTDVVVGPVAFRSNDERTLIRLEPVGSASHLMTTEASEGFQVTIPKGTPSNPPLQFGHYYTENEKVALPIKVACGVEFITNQAKGGVMGHVIVKLVGNPSCGPSEFLSMSVEVSLAELGDCGILENGFKFSPPNARYNPSTKRVLWEPSPEPFGLGVAQMFQAKFWCDRELPKQALTAVIRFECKGVVYSNTDAQVHGQQYKLRGVAKRTMFKVDCLV